MNKKKFLGILGVVFLGALGSGLWELIKPLLSWGWTGLLTLYTLGLSSLRDGIYANAAGGKSVNITIVIQLLAGIVSLTGFAVIGYIRTSFRPVSNAFSIFYEYILIVLMITTIVASSRSFYILGLSNYSTKLETIASPHISDVELKHLRAKSIQIQNRADYLAYTKSLQEIIEAAGKNVPTREFF